MTIHENNYRFGTGELVLRVVWVGAVEHLADGDWLTVVGVELDRYGAEFGERQVVVRLSLFFNLASGDRVASYVYLRRVGAGCEAATA